MSPIVPDPSAAYTFPAHRVYLASRWTTPTWTERPHLYCNWLHRAVGPGHDRAELHWIYGPIRHQRATEEVTEIPLDGILDSYVKIEIDPAGPGDPGVTWYGIVTEVSERQLGIIPGAPPRGEETFLCHGLSILLDRAYVLESFYEAFGGLEQSIGRGLGFNSEHNWLKRDEDPAERAGKRFGNRSVLPGALGPYVFAEDLSTAEFWSSKDIAEYLLEYHAPADLHGSPTVPWGLTERALATMPTWDRPVIAADGQTLWRILGQLFDRRRFMGFRVVVEPKEGELDKMMPKLDVFGFSDEWIVLPDGGEVGANPNTRAIDVDPCVDVAEMALKASAEHQVERVICRAARKRSVATFSFHDATLEGDWDEGDQVAYEEGPNYIGDPPDEQTQCARIKLWRTEDRLKRVFCYFRVPLDWDGLVGDGVGGAKQRCFPDDPDYGAEQIYRGQARFESDLPAGILIEAPAQSPQDSIQAAAWIKVWSNEGQDRYQHVEKLGADRMAAVFLAQHPGGDISCNLQVQRYGMGIVLRVHGGRMHGQEALAATDFSPSSLSVDALAPPYDWREMFVTAMFELDSHLEVAWPPTEELPLPENCLDVARTIVVDLGMKYRLDYVAPGTVKGVIDGIPQRVAEGYYIRDDRAKVRQLARLVAAWYARERQAISLTLRHVVDYLAVGDLVTTLSAGANLQEVNSIVSSVRIDLVRGLTEITTDFAELDPSQF